MRTRASYLIEIGFEHLTLWRYGQFIVATLGGVKKKMFG